MYALPKSPETTKRSFSLAPDLLVIVLLIEYPIAVMLIIMPLFELVVSPPTRSILNFLQAARIPK